MAQVSELESWPAIRDFLARAASLLAAAGRELKEAYPEVRTGVLKSVTDTRLLTTHLRVSWPDWGQDDVLGIDLCLTFSNDAGSPPKFEAYVVLDDESGTQVEEFGEGKRFVVDEARLAELLADLPRLIACVRRCTEERMASRPPVT